MQQKRLKLKAAKETTILAVAKQTTGDIRLNNVSNCHLTGAGGGRLMQQRRLKTYNRDSFLPNQKVEIWDLDF
ncbi:unnamed protein product [Urochloa humidicola]